MAAMGTAVAHLHDQSKPAGPPRTFVADLDDLAVFTPLFTHLAPTLAPTFSRALSRLSEEAARNQTDFVPTHGALRTDQLLVAEDGIVALDWDGFCWAHPARDIGNLLAYLDWRAIRRPQDRAIAVAAGRTFLDSYAETRPGPPQATLRFARNASVLKIAGRRLAGLTFDEWDLLPDLLATIH
jgi:aminoglycoside phosphotransferase (APT) family kinase protein